MLDHQRIDDQSVERNAPEPPDAPQSDPRPFNSSENISPAAQSLTSDQSPRAASRTKNRSRVWASVRGKRPARRLPRPARPLSATETAHLSRLIESKVRRLKWHHADPAWSANDASQ